MQRFIRAAYRAAAITGLLTVSPAFAGDPGDTDDKGIFNLIYENDIFADSDNGYTNGVRLAWLSAEADAPGWTRHSLLPLAPEGKKRLSLALGQSMFTPNDKNQRTPIRNDRPYAGWLYGSVGATSDTGHTLDNFILTVGVVGPWSLAGPTQRFVHRVLDRPRPYGWDNQLQNEPGVMLTYERKWRALYAFSPFGLAADVTPHTGVNLGNVITDATAGAVFRLGYDLPADYGPPRIRPSLSGSDFFVPSEKFGAYLFAGAEGRAVGRNIFLDGNSFSNSLDVDKKIMVGSLQLGAAVMFNNMRLSYAHVFMTKEFDQQREPEQFGALTLSWRF